MILGLIRQYEEEKSNETFNIYKPEDGMLGTWYSQLNETSKEFKGTDPYFGVNPAQGIVIYYQLPKLADSIDVTLEIKNGDGVTVNTFSSKKITEPKFHSPKLSKDKGINRFVWNMRHRNLNTVANVRLEGDKRGHIASPGDYTITVKLNHEEQVVGFTILANPTYELTAEDYQEYHIYMSQMEAVYNTILENLNDLNKMKDQLKGVIKELDAEKHSELLKIGDSLVNRIQNWDEEIVQRKTKVYDDVENFPNKFTAQYLFLLNQTQSSLPRITNSSRERRIDLDTQWKAFEMRYNKLITVDIPDFNKMLWEAGFGILRK